MDGSRFRCLGCGRVLLRRTPTQRYCGRQDCRKARKNAWRRKQYASDPDYRANQIDSTRAWLAAQGGAAKYYREYRRRRKASSSSRKRSPARPAKPKPRRPDGPSVPRANSDARSEDSAVFSGVYRLVPQGSANSDAFLVNLSVISDGSKDSQISTV